MRKIKVLTFLTLDGVMQAPGGPTEDTSGGFEFGGWTVPFFDDEAGALMDQQMKEPFSLLLGRKTFEIFAGYWPHHAESWPGINEATKFVASTTLTHSTWSNTRFLSGDAADAVQKITQEPGPDMYVYGSGNLVQTLMKHDLVSEFWLKIFPITLGTGKRLFESGTMPANFSVTESHVTKRGIVFVNYTRAGKVQTGSF